MNICVIGIGYVGAVTAACFADRGHRVVGVDIDETKVAQINRGESPIIEPGLDGLIADHVASGRLRATSDTRDAVRESDIIMVCVGTPSDRTGGQSTQALVRATAQVGEGIAKRTDTPVVVYRSTILPGTCEDLLVPLLEESSGLRRGKGFGVAVNPEFLREGKAIDEFMNPEKTVVGQLDSASGEGVESLYGDLGGQLFRIGLKEAEFVKYVENTFHALKATFANEIGVIGRQIGVDSHQVMDILCADSRLNLSPAYLRPGFAFGGSCLPKDVRALNQKARSIGVSAPLIGSILPSNATHIDWALEQITSLGQRNVGLFGLAFKDGTDDLRESPLLELCERLLGKGYAVKVFDPTVRLSALRGSNKRFLEDHLPHIEAVLTERPQFVIDHSAVCVVGSRDASVFTALRGVKPDQHVIDLVRVPEELGLQRLDGYTGIAW